MSDSQSQGKLLQFILDPKYWVWRHLLFWSFFYFNTLLTVFGFLEQTSGFGYHVGMFVFELILVYTNIYFLLPRLFTRGKLIQYAIATLVLLLLITAVDTYHTFTTLECCYEDYTLADKLAEFVHTFFFRAQIVGAAVGIKLGKYYYNSSINLEQVKVEKLNTELGFLRNQVNPHFLFNVMNSFYIQAKKKDERLPDAILSLSDLLRYQIYDTQKEFVSVVSELEYIKNYLELEKNRRDNLTVEITADNISKHHKIAPLLLLPLVENAVKYSQGLENATIELGMAIKDEKIIFSMVNSKGDVKKIKSPDSGIGLDNLQKRLQLIYPNDHKYTIEDQSDTYRCTVEIGVR